MIDPLKCNKIGRESTIKKKKHLLRIRLRLTVGKKKADDFMIHRYFFRFVTSRAI